MKKNALNTIQTTQEDLGNIIDRDRETLLDSIRTLEKRVIADTNKLVSGENGKLVGPRINIKQAHQIHADLVKNFKETYEDTAFRVTKGYNQSVKMVKNVYKDLDVSAEFTGVDKDMISSLQNQSYNEYLAYGQAAQESISKAMYNAVLTKGSREDLIGAVSAALTGHLSKSGKPMSAYADVWANDGIMNFHQTVLMKKGNDAGLTSYLYVGNVMGTTRPFCAERAMGTYTKEEIESWDFNWKGKSGPALTNRGGWNCRHHWQPVKKEDAKELEKEIKEDPKIQKELKDAEKLRGVPEVEEAPEYQSFDRYLESADFDWEFLDVDPDDVPTIQNNIIKSRFEDAGNELSDEAANDIRISINEYTSELYSEYGEWVRDPKAYGEEREDWQVDVMKNMDNNLRSYVGNTLPFSSEEELYRGKQDVGSLEGVEVGDTVDLTYLSSFSVDETVAKEFAEGGDDQVIMVLNKGNTFNSASLAEFSESGYEKEVLLGNKNRLLCTSTEERDGITYMYFDSVEVSEEQRAVEEELEDKELEIKRLAKELEVVEEPVVYQEFNKEFEESGFDWESIEDDYEKIEEMQLDILKERLKEGGISIPKVELEGVFDSIQKYTKSDFKEFQIWSFDKSKYPDIESLDRFRKIEKDLNMYINETPRFDKDTILYRGTSFEHYKDLEVGDDLEHKVFTSWTTDGDQAVDFASEVTTEGDEVEDPAILVINKGNQTYSSSIAEFSEYGDEQEVLLSDMNKLVLTSVEEKDGVKYMYFDTKEITVEELEEKAKERADEEEKLEDKEAEERAKAEEGEGDLKDIEDKQKLLNKISIYNMDDAEAMASGKYDWRKYYEEVVVWGKISDEDWESEYVPTIKEKVEKVRGILEGEGEEDEEDEEIEEDEEDEEEGDGWTETEEAEDSPYYIDGEFQGFDEDLIDGEGEYHGSDEEIEAHRTEVLQERFMENDIELTDEDSEEMLKDILDYTSGDYYDEFKEWSEDPSSDAFSEEEVEKFKSIEKSLNSYVDNTLQFNPNMELYRGLFDEEEASVSGLKIGEKLELDNFTSWSTYEDSATDYSEGGDNPVIMVINRHNKTYSSSLAEFSEDGSEREVLVSGRNKLVLKGIEEKEDAKYMYFDVAEEGSLDKAEAEELAKEIEEERIAKEEAERIVEEERIAKEEAERIVEEERIAKEEAEKQLEAKLEEERILKEVEEAEKTVKEEAVGYVEGKEQVFNKAFVKSGFDWESVEEDYEKIEKKQIGLLQKRMKDSGLPSDKKSAENLFEDIGKFTGSNKFEGFQEWTRDRSVYPSVKSLNEFRKIEKHLDMYVNETTSYSSKKPIYRGTSLSHSTYQDLEVGDTIQPTGFTSWSASFDEAKSFAVEDTAEGTKVEDPVILQINKGNQSYSSSIAEFSKYGSEQEVLLSNRNKLVLTNVEDKDGIKYMYFDTVDLTVQELETMEEERNLEDEKLKPEEERREAEEDAEDRLTMKKENIEKGLGEPIHEEGYSVIPGNFQNFDPIFVKGGGSYHKEGKELDEIKREVIKDRYTDNGKELTDKEVNKIFKSFDDYFMEKSEFDKWVKDPDGDFSKSDIKTFKAMDKAFTSYLEDTQNFNPNMNLYQGFTNYANNSTFNTLQVGDKLETGKFSNWTSSPEVANSKADASWSFDADADSTIAVIRKGTEVESSAISDLTSSGGDSLVMLSDKNNLILESIEEKDGKRYMYFEQVDIADEELEEKKLEIEEKKLEEERIAKEELEAKLAEEKRIEELEVKVEEERVAKEEAEKKLEESKAVKYQTINEEFEDVDFNWDDYSDDPQEIENIKTKILTERFADNNVKVSYEDIKEVKNSIHNFTDDKYYDKFREWTKDESKYSGSKKLIKDFEKTKEYLNKYIDETPSFAADVPLYRGKRKLGSLEGIKVGDNLKFTGFSSFSVDEDEASTFANYGDSKNPVVMVIDKGNKTNSSSIAEFSKAGHEQEVLLNNNNELICIDRYKDEDGVTYIHFDSTEKVELDEEIEEKVTKETEVIEDIDFKTVEEVQSYMDKLNSEIDKIQNSKNPDWDLILAKRDSIDKALELREKLKK